MQPTPAADVNETLDRLIGSWCERRELKALSLVLPAWLANGGLTDQWADLMDALDMLTERRVLPDDEQAEVERVAALVRRIVYRR